MTTTIETTQRRENEARANLEDAVRKGPKTTNSTIDGLTAAKTVIDKAIEAKRDDRRAVARRLKALAEKLAS